MTTMTVKDSLGATQTVAKIPATHDGTAIATGSSPVALALDDPLLTLVKAPTTGTQTSVASATSDTVLLASNAARKGGYFMNESTSALDILLSNAVSSATLKTQRLAAGDSFQILPGGYTGVVKGIWVTANGFCRVTEFT